MLRSGDSHRMTRLYGPHYERLWRDALLLPGHDDLLASLATEVAAFDGDGVEETTVRMEQAFAERAAFQRANFPSDPEQALAYYADRNGIYVSAYWHSLRADRYVLHAVAGLHAAQQLATGDRVIEFGHGIGSAALLFRQHGFDVTAGDVGTTYRDFARARFEARGLEIPLVALEREEAPAQSFDAIVSFDVIEHVPRPLEAIVRLRDWLAPDGVLIMNVAVGLDPATPEHLIPRRLGFEDRIRSLGFERVPHPSLLVLYRRDHSRSRRALYRAQDTVVAARDDVVARYPVAGPLLKPSRPPAA